MYGQVPCYHNVSVEVGCSVCENSELIQDLSPNRSFGATVMIVVDIVGRSRRRMKVRGAQGR
jgi:hypothetical protein